MKNQDLIQLFNDAYTKSGDRFGGEEIIRIKWNTFALADINTYGAGGCQVYVECKQDAPYTFSGQVWLKYKEGKILYNWECRYPKYVLPDDGSKFYKWIYDKVVATQGIKETMTIKGLGKCFLEKPVEFIYIKMGDLWYIQCRNVFKQELYNILSDVYPQYKWGYDYIPDRTFPYANEVCITTPFEVAFCPKNKGLTYDIEIYIK